MRGRRELDAATALVRQLRDRSFTRDWLLAGWYREQEGQASVVGLSDVYPEVERMSIELGSVTYTSWNMDPTERFVLGALAQLTKPRRIFEFGTFDGSATWVLARNAPKAKIDTIDLPVDHPASAVAAGALSIVGERVLGEPRVEQHFADSRSFNFDRWEGAVDMVLIDAGHLYEDVHADTEAALRMLSDNGLIVWDDYTRRWPGVIRAVDETGLPSIHISGTELVIYDRALHRATSLPAGYRRQRI
jgi:predicted O-methyltransferase YrrM